MELPIQNLIDFIMSNVWLLIIVIGFVANTFRRFKSGESEPTTPPVSVPKQFNPFEQQQKPEKDEYQVETKYDIEEPETIDASNSPVPNTFYERYLELQEQGTYSETIDKEEEEARVMQVLKPRETTESKTVQSFSKNKVVEGIIWSEILGPPRAKKPYQIRR